MGAYEAALAGQPLEICNPRVKPGTVRALALSYFNSGDFRSLASSTKSTYRNIIERFCNQTDKQGSEYGDKGAATLRREHIVKLMASRADKPESANGLRKALRALMKHAVELGMCMDYRYKRRAGHSR